jgi:hypothetical protein
MEDKEKPADPETQPTELDTPISAREEDFVSDPDLHKPGGPLGPPFQVGGKISLERSAVASTEDQALWGAIRNRTQAIQGDGYEDFINRVLCKDDDADTRANYVKGKTRGPEASIHARRTELLAGSTGYGVDAYQLLKYATQAFLLLEAGVVIRDPQLPFDRIGDAIVPREESRIGQSVTFRELEGRLETYLTDTLGPQLP